MEHSLEQQNMTEKQKFSRIRGPKGTNRMTLIATQVTGNPYLPGTPQHAVFEAMPKPYCTLEAFFESLMPSGLKQHGSKTLKQAVRRGYIRLEGEQFRPCHLEASAEA
jgi:hypothetical protein